MSTTLSRWAIVVAVGLVLPVRRRLCRQRAARGRPPVRSHVQDPQ